MPSHPYAPSRSQSARLAIDLVAPKRSAHASIRGYLYQACVGVERWLSLKEGEVLLCEGDEDLDRLLLEEGLGVIEQVKVRSRPVEDRVLRESLQRFAETFVALRQRGEDRQFVFICTAERARAGRRFDGIDPMSYWLEGGEKRSEVEQETARGAVRRWLALETESATKDGGNLRHLEGALAWLDGEVGRWRAFLDRVEWRFGAPDIDGVRAVIEERLQQRSDANSLPLGEVLVDWLVSRVLKASSHPGPVERVLTREGLNELLVEVAGELTDWSRRQGFNIRQAFKELAGLGPLLTPGVASLPLVHTDHGQSGLVPPGKLLTAAYEVVPFEEEARAGELGELEAWCNEKRSRMAWLWTGELGAGKTRLAIELCRRLAAIGWETGFLRLDVRTDDLESLVRGVLPRLVVVDNAQTRLELLKAVLTRVGEAQGPPKLRLLLLARQAGAWWGLLKLASRDAEDLLLSSPIARSLGPLVKNEREILEAYRRALISFHEITHQAMPEDFSPPVFSAEEARLPLLLHMRALESKDVGTLPGADGLLSRLVNRERMIWGAALQDLRILYGSIPACAEGMIEKTMASITMLGGVSNQVEAEAVAEAAGSHSPAERRVIIEVLHRLYSGPEVGGQFVQALQPDRLGEELVAQVLGGRHDR